MSRILAIDYGSKRCGIAVTDPLRIVPQGLATIATPDLLSFLEDYLDREAVSILVLGEPLHADGRPTRLHQQVVGLQRKLQRRFPGLDVALWDERFTSQDAREVIRQSGAKRKKRQDRALVDKVSAMLILRDYMENLTS